MGCCGNLFKFWLYIYLPIWFAGVLVVMAPEWKTDFSRCVAEIFWWARFGFNTLTSGGDLSNIENPRLDIAKHYQSSKPVEDFGTNYPKSYDPNHDTYYVTWENATAEIIGKTLIDGDGILVFKSFMERNNSWLMQFEDPDFVYEYFKDVEKPLNFFGNGTHLFDEKASGIRTKRPFAEGFQMMRNREKLYLGFETVLGFTKEEFMINYKLELSKLAKLANQPKRFAPDTLWIAFCFMYFDRLFPAARQHNAPVSNMFLQVANKKEWVITKPITIPYIDPVYYPTQGYIGTNFQFAQLGPLDVPRVHIITEPGDFLFFPRWWPHEVWNHDGFGFAFAFRNQREVILALRNVFMPWFAIPGELPLDILYWWRNINPFILIPNAFQTALKIQNILWIKLFGHPPKKQYSGHSVGFELGEDQEELWKRAQEWMEDDSEYKGFHNGRTPSFCSFFGTNSWKPYSC